jgi:hypothetical protein
MEANGHLHFPAVFTALVLIREEAGYFDSEGKPGVHTQTVSLLTLLTELSLLAQVDFQVEMVF